MDYPSVIPLFPLPNVVMFPGVPLPLHIFEPRYCEMIKDTKDAHQFIGMTLLRDDWGDQYYGNPPIYSIGCAGRIVSVESLPDGRYNILLHGSREFIIEREMREKSYRQAEVRWRPLPPADLLIPEGLREQLVGRLRECLALHVEEAARKLLDDPTLGDQLLVNFFCYALDLTPLEKQALLEADSMLTRAVRLNEVMEFHLHEARTGAISSIIRSGRSH